MPVEPFQRRQGEVVLFPLLLVGWLLFFGRLQLGLPVDFSICLGFRICVYERHSLPQESQVLSLLMLL